MYEIWLEMAKKIMANDVFAFATDYKPEDLAAAMAEAWGENRAVALWTLEDVLERAEENDLEITEGDGRDAMNELVVHLEGLTAYDILDDILFEKTGGYEDYD